MASSLAVCAPQAAGFRPAPAHSRSQKLSTSSSLCSTRQALSAACSRPQASHRPWQCRLAPPRAAAEEGETEAEADGEADAEEGVEEELALEEYLEESVFERAIRLEREKMEQDRLAGIKPVLKVTQQYGLKPWKPGTKVTQAQREGAAADDAGGTEPGASAAAAAPGTARPSYEELLQQLPGLQEQLRLAAQDRVGLARKEREPDQIEYADERYARKPEPELNEWDLRAKMEKRRRQQREMDEWNERRARVGQYPSMGADWRSDVRCQDTGDPTDPVYREWTHKEIWDLITLNGRNADPRDVQLFVRNPLEIADAPAEGAEYRMDPEEYFESRGQLIGEEDLAAIAAADKEDAEEVALLASEFSDFDDQLVGGADFDSEYGATDGGDDGNFG